MIDHVDDDAFLELCKNLHEDRLSAAEQWPQRQLDRMSAAGVYRWFVARDQGGLEWSNQDLARAYLASSKACLASTFVLTQRVAAIKRVAASPNPQVLDRYLPPMLSGQSTATVGISHLTTSGLHLRRPVLVAEKRDGGYLLNGACPWVTGANDVAHVLVGAVVETGSEAGRQILALVSTDQPGVTVAPPFQLLALTETHTGKVTLQDVWVPADTLVAGPHENVLASLTAGPSTGSYQSSALALGLAEVAIEFMRGESASRPTLRTGVDSLQQSHDRAVKLLLEAAAGNPQCSNESLRAEANSLVLRATQAALVAAKGAGFTAGHPVGRWCREAMFFLVWSCPQAVLDANLCELAGVE